MKEATLETLLAEATMKAAEISARMPALLRELAKSIAEIERLEFSAELVADLEAEMYGLNAPLGEATNAYRKGWNDRATSLIRDLRGGK